MKSKNIAAGALGLAVSLSTTFTSGIAHTTPLNVTSPSSSNETNYFEPYGSKFFLTVNNGTVFHIIFDESGKQVTYRNITENGPEEHASSVISKLSDGVYSITWWEPAGDFTVNHIENYNTGEVKLTWSYPGEDGNHSIEHYTGNIEFFSDLDTDIRER